MGHILIKPLLVGLVGVEMDGIFTVLVSLIIIVLLAVTFTAVYHSIGGIVAANTKVLWRETTMMAVLNTGGDTYYVEVVWTGPPIPPKYFVLANGQLVKPPQPYQCGVGYTPAPYRYCIYVVQATAQPIGMVMGG